MTPDLATFREWRAQLTLDPLDPADPAETRYVPIEEAGRGAVDDIFSLLELAMGPTTQLLSGPSGSGKTTELKRLRGRLQEAGFAVVMADILGDRRRRVPHRARAGVRRGPASRRAGPGTSVAGPLPRAPPADQGAGRRPGVGRRDRPRQGGQEQPAVRRRAAPELGYHLGDLHEEVAGFCQERVRAYRGANPGSAGVVMIIDSLEKVRGTTENDAAVQASVERLLVHHSDKLRFSSHHTVYTVPPYLMFTAANVDELAKVVERRIPWKELLGSETLLREVILASGGHLRDLFTILQELVMLVNGRRLPLPALPQHVQEATGKVALAFSSITKEDATFLRRVDEARGDVEPEAAQVGRLARLLHTHMILAHRNGGTWYEVHPLARPALGLP